MTWLYSFVHASRAFYKDITIIKMKINKNIHPWKACLPLNSGRDALECIHFKGRYAYASNALIAIRVSVESLIYLQDWEMATEDINGYVDILSGYSIHAKVLKMFASLGDFKITAPDGIPTLTAKIGFNEISASLVKSGQIKAPDIASALVPNQERKPIEKIGINPEMLKDLTDALGLSDVRLDFTTADNKIFIHSDMNEFDTNMGIIMPKIITASIPGFE